MAVLKHKKGFEVTHIVRTPDSPLSGIRFDITYISDVALGTQVTETFILDQPTEPGRTTCGLLGELIDSSGNPTPDRWVMRPINSPLGTKVVVSRQINDRQSTFTIKR